MLYMGTVAPGMEAILESEIQTKLAGAWVQATFRGRVLFGSTQPVAKIFALRCVDNIYAHIAWFRVGPHKADLKQLREAVASANLSTALALAGTLPQKPCAFVSASRSGKHSYSRFDAADAVFAALQKQHGFALGSLEYHDLAFRLDIIDTNALLSLKLTPPAYRFRGEERRFSAAALRPPVAHGLVWASIPSADDIFLDPFCGSGTIAAERAVYTAQRIIASDLNPDVVEIAKTNMPVNVEVRLGDARCTNLPEHSISCIVTNPPWGNQISADTGITQLYREFLVEAKRLLMEHGRMLIFTDQVDALQHSCQELELPCNPLYTVSLHGLVPRIFRITPA